MIHVVLDARKLTTPETAHPYLKEVLELPDYYGMNLDALKDCLEEMPDIHLILVHMAEAADNDCLKRILTVGDGSLPSQISLYR